MHVVRHQAPAPHLDPGRAAMLGEQVAIQRIIVVAEKSSRPAVAALGDMMRMTGDDDAGKTGHTPWCLRRRAMSIECTVTVILDRLAHGRFSSDGL